jgi:GT2 family glycosyltransferase
MEAKKIKVSIIIPNWNTKKLLKRCLESLKWGVRSGRWEVVVVDNGSSDGSVKMMEKWWSATRRKDTTSTTSLKIIRNRTNLGFGAANNQGMRIAKGDYFLLLNSDTIVKNSAPLKMAQFLDKHPEVGVVGCKLLNPDGSSQPSAGPFPNLGMAAVMLFLEHWFGDLVRASFNKTKEVDWVMGAALMVRPEVVKKAGWMDEGIFMYMDEVEWCYRIKKGGWKVMFYPGAEIIHIGGASSKTGRKEPILNIYRGLVYFYKKHYPGWKLSILQIMLKLKAGGALMVGWLTKNNYLKQTYAEALKIASD